METKQPYPSKPAPCTPEDHRPANFEEFEAMVENIRSWNWSDDPLMMLGECRGCGSSLSHRRPKGSPDCFAHREGLSPETVTEIEAIQSRAVEAVCRGRGE